MLELYGSNWCDIGNTPSVSRTNSIKFIYFDTPGSPFSRKEEFIDTKCIFDRLFSSILKMDFIAVSIKKIFILI